MSRKYFGLIVLMIFTIACRLEITRTGNSDQPAIAQVLVTADPMATQTSTPFQPAQPTSTVVATSTPEVSPTPSYNSPSSNWTSPLYPGMKIPEGQVHILVLGSDWRPSAGFRTDTIMLVAITPSTNSVSVVSFPRDLYVNIPGYGTNRINTALPKGFSVMADTFENNFGVRPDYYIMTNFQGFIQTVNELGGIDVEAAQNLTDRCDLPVASNGYCSFGPGTIHMDGDTALWYVRSRYSTSDFDRLRRSQEVLRGMFNRLMSLDVVNHVPEMYEIYRQNVETDLNLDIIKPLVDVAPHLYEPEAIRTYAVSTSEVIPYRVPETGAQVLLPKQEVINAIIQKAFFVKDE